MPKASDATEFLPVTSASSLRVHAVNLEVTAGPDLGRRLRVDRPTLVIGSGSSADLRLSDGAISREHLRVALTPAGVRLRDEGSRNGSWIGGLTANESYVASLADIGVRVQGGDSAAAISGALAQQAESARADQTGVNLDEEAARLMQFQQSYQAAAKVLQIAQSVFDTLLQTATG